MRLDKYLVFEGYFESRNRALEAIKSAQVTVDGHSAKPSTHIGENTLVEVADAKYYVSRAARKLEGFLSKYPLELEDKRALDVGSSTGGFTQILLERRIAHVDCVDVGRDQLHTSLRNDPRVGVHEQTDIRDFYTDTPYEVIVSDVSFISLLHILDAIDRLSAKGAQIVLLFKPQFEVGREASRDRRGVVTDEGAIQRAMDAFELATAKLGWQRLQKTPSQYRGREGNQEWVYLFRRVGADSISALGAQ